MSKTFVEYDIQLVAKMAETYITADSLLGYFIDSAAAHALAVKALLSHPDVEEQIYTLYGRFEDGTVMAIFDGTSYEACGRVYQGVTGLDPGDIHHDMKGLLAAPSP